MCTYTYTYTCISRAVNVPNSVASKLLQDFVEKCTSYPDFGAVVWAARADLLQLCHAGKVVLPSFEEIFKLDLAECAAFPAGVESVTEIFLLVPRAG